MSHAERPRFTSQNAAFYMASYKLLIARALSALLIILLIVEVVIVVIMAEIIVVHVAVAFLESA